MDLKVGQLVLKVRDPNWQHKEWGAGTGLVPLGSIGEVRVPKVLCSDVIGDPYGTDVHWPKFKGGKVITMQRGTIIPLNDPDYKETTEKCAGEKDSTMERLLKVNSMEGQS